MPPWPPHPQPGPHGPLGVIFVRLGIAKVDQQAIAEVLGDMPLKALDHLGAGVLVGPHHLPQLFRVELAGERGRVHQVTEQHGELAAFGVGRRWDWPAAVAGTSSPVEPGQGSCPGSHPAMRWLRGRCWGTRPHQDTALLIDGEPLALDEFVLQILQLSSSSWNWRLSVRRSRARGAGAWRSPGRGSPQRSSPTLPMPMRRAEDGVGIGKAVRAYLYRRWLTKESRKSWERVTQK